MKSLSAIAKCIGVTASTLSIRHDFFGYRTTAVTRLSIGTQVKFLTGRGRRHVHMNIIRVGSDQFSDADEREIDQAIKRTRDIFAPAAVGVGRIEYWDISTGDAAGRDVIDNDAEAEALTNEWTTPNGDAMDIFFVRAYVSDTAGLSAVDGPCNKDAAGMDGCVVEMNAGGGVSDLALAHEAGHYLGLPHREPDDGSALMNGTAPNSGGINRDEAEIMSNHCFMRLSC